jgi:proteasome accessory factor B
MIAMLRGPKSYNVRRLSERFGTTGRNIHRDLALLELAGVPFYYDPEHGVGGGYRIRSDWFFPTVGLTRQECIDLAVMARGVESGRGIPLLDTAADVRDKLLATVDPEHQDCIRQASELFDIIGLRMADHSRCRGIMVAFQEALLSRKQIEGIYFTPHGKKTVKVHLQPRRVFLAGNCWYAACRDNQSGKDKLYRLARFKEANVIRKEMTVDASFSLRDFLGNAWVAYRGERDWPVEIHFDAQAAPLIAEVNWHQTQKMLWQDDGSLIFRATVSGLEEVKFWVLGFGPQAKVLKPKQLADEVQELAAQTVAQYRQEHPKRKEGKP